MTAQNYFGSDLIVDLMKQYEIEYAALNPGASFRGIHESIVNYGGNKRPEIITCCHEEIAVAIAHGYALAKKKPMVALCHNVVGLQHASMAIYNAWLNRVPVMVLGGTGPMDTQKRRPWIDWIHTALVQGNAVRDYVKWDDQPASIDAVPDSFARAYKICMTKPYGPIYLCYDAEMQERKIDHEISLPDRERLTAPTPVQAPNAVIEEVAHLLVSAQNPVVIADRMGYNPKSPDSLIQLAELLNLPVIDTEGAFNFPNNHPLDLTGSEDQLLGEADLVLGLEVYDLSQQLKKLNTATRTWEYRIPKTAKVVHVTLNDLLISKWTCDFNPLVPVDLSICADTDEFLPALIIACKKKLQENPSVKERYSERIKKFAGLKEAATAGWLKTRDQEWDNSPISMPRLASELWDVVKEYDWTFTTNTINGWSRRLWKWSKPEQVMRGSGVGGLGLGLGHSLGVALAFREQERLCIDFQTDGDLLFIPSALWTAAHHKIPLLIVMNNNHSYASTERHQRIVSRLRNRPQETAGIGTRFVNPTIGFAQMARAYGLMGIGPVDNPGELRGAFEKAVKHVVNNKCAALVDVVTG